MVLVPSSSSFVGPPPRKMYSIKSSVKLWLVLRWVLGREQSSFTYLVPVYQFSHLCIQFSHLCVWFSYLCVSYPTFVVSYPTTFWREGGKKKDSFCHVDYLFSCIKNQFTIL